ncbi:MAG TPA: serine/threonine protein kinase [Pyrinomonadaceae bacterium]|nr:serine/threonine protein kinase [Pyrinomonadaceae bacterium]
MAELKLQQSRLDGRYDIIECLGRGSYAEIYVAHDNAASDGAPETVVIKALNMFLQDAPDEALEHTLIENFQNEAVALDRVRHPNIINRLGHGTAIDLAGTTFHYIVLEYLSGGDMAALSRSKPLPIDKALFYLEQVCSGLAHAHECGVIHRDIKPQNLLLTADREVVKIADFGVARLEANEGAITRVGTNIYAAPEHNPLVQTGALDLGAIAAGREHLTPAADIYSLAKTTYALLAGESPRRFAQHSIKDMPATVSNQYWSAAVLRVLEKATQTRPDQRYQTVQEYWDDLADATLPATRPLPGAELGSGALRRRPSSDLSIEPEEFTEAPPQPRFQPVKALSRPVMNESRLANQYADPAGARRPKIVVPVAAVYSKQASARDQLEGRSAKERIAALPDEPRSRKVPPSRSHKRREVGPRKARPYLVAAILILAFAGMLLATHKYVTSHWNPFVGLPLLSDVFVIGREGVTTTDVNLRSDASVANAPIGLAEAGSRVKILATGDNWYEVQVLQHGRPKTDPFTSDRGWINKKFVKFD